MKYAAVICEYNPFHNGHAYQIAKIRELLGDTTVISIMSGNFVQRGGVALLPKYERAEAAVRGGADLVLELPFPYSLAPAEIFASAGVSIAASLGVCEYLAFGSESGDADALALIAERLSSSEFKKRFAALRDSPANAALSGASLRERLYGEMYLGQHLAILRKPNDILAIEYLTALADSGMTPLAVKRAGASHDGADTAGEFASAGHLREAALSGGAEAFRSFVPDGSLECYLDAEARGVMPAKFANLDRVVLSLLRSADIKKLSAVAEMTPDLAAATVAAARAASSVAEMLSSLKSKTYTDAKLRRAVTYALAGTKSAAQSSKPAYTQLLAANARGRAALREIKKLGSIPILTKPADADKLPRTAEKQFLRSASADEIYTLAFEKPLPAGSFIAKTPYMSKSD